MAYRQNGEGPFHSIDMERGPSHPGEKDRSDSVSEHTPLSPRPDVAPPIYPSHDAEPRVQIAIPNPGSYPPVMNSQSRSSSNRNFHQLPEDSSNGTSSTRPPHSRNASWDIFGGLQKNWEGFDSRNATETNFQFAEGDIPKNKLTKFYSFLLNASIVTRWFVFIVPILALLWIPGILSLTAYPSASIWHVRLIWWSVWWSVIWVSWWAALAAAMLLPHLLRYTLGVAAVSLRKYFEWFNALQRPVAFVGWSVAAWVSYNPLINERFTASDSTSFPSSKSALTLVGRIMFGLMLCSIILFGEKFAIQFVAYKFHQRSYADRIAHQKAQMECLVTLYRNSSDVDRSDTLHNPKSSRGGSTAINPSRFFKAALKGVRRTAETTTTAFGNMASEIAGSSLLQPNSPAAMVTSALMSANKSRMLARRLYYSFRAEDADRLILGDIGRFFPSREMATFAFEIFDKDENGDATKEEMEGAILEIHNERMSLAASMKDVDSATGRLDNILMSIYILLVMLIFAIMLDAQVSSLITGAGTFVLGLSWLIGGSAQEVLTSIVFLFMKHPFDIGDNIEIDGVAYTVKEIRLLSTVLIDSRGCDVQCPNTVLNTKYIMNRRRSGPMSEPFEFSCHYSTTFEQIEDLRSRMLTFVKLERRDYLPVFDVYVQDFPDQSSMKLKVDIKYKSNWQMGALKAQRRNKWICALKNALLASKIFGPSGDPNAASGPQEITLVPYDKAPGEGGPIGFPEARPSGASPGGVGIGRTDYQFTDRNIALTSMPDNVFGEEVGARLGNSRPPVPQPNVYAGGEGNELRARNVSGGSGASPIMSSAERFTARTPPEEIEMTPGRRV